MSLEGTLDAFSLADILQLLGSTNKTGALHVRRGDAHGAVHLRDGAVCGARPDVSRQALGRRMVGAGLVDDDALAAAIERVVDEPALGLGRALADAGGLDETLVLEVATEQATDAVFDLLRWSDGEFAFLEDELDLDDMGANLPVEEVIAEGRRRLESWATLTTVVPSPAAVLSLSPCPDGMSASREEWALLSLVDGVRTVGELVALSARGEYVVVSVLAGLIERGLLAAGDPASSAVVRRQRLLCALEGRPDPTGQDLPSSPAPAPRPQVIPQRPEPSVPVRRAQPAEEPAAGYSRSTGSLALLADEAAPSPSPYVDRDSDVNMSLLLRLIAGVRGL